LLNQYKAGAWNITFYDLMAANGDLLSRAKQRLEVTHAFEIDEFKNQDFTFRPWVVSNTGWNLTCHEMGRSPRGYFNSTYEGAFSDIENAAVCSTSLRNDSIVHLYILFGLLLAQVYVVFTYFWVGGAKC